MNGWVTVVRESASNIRLYRREALALEPTNMACATNMALSELYNSQLLKAVDALEAVRSARVCACALSSSSGSPLRCRRHAPRRTPRTRRVQGARRRPWIRATRADPPVPTSFPRALPPPNFPPFPLPLAIHADFRARSPPPPYRPLLARSPAGNQGRPRRHDLRGRL